jgi:uncharacterized protein YbbC (DUF1343 family)
MKLNRLSLVQLALLLPAAVLANSQVKTGLEVLRDSKFSQLKGRKVIVLSNPTGVTADLETGVDVMHESGQVNLVGVMGPEHGFRGTAQAGGSEGSFVDEKTGLTVYDAYNANTTTLVKYITESGADTVVFDIQDVGSRFYTCECLAHIMRLRMLMVNLDIWAMYDTMVAAALKDARFVVLDRPNPITGLNAFGPVLNESYVTSYVGRRAIAQAHGMTAGELAKMFVGEGWIKEASGGKKLDLQVVEMKKWKRSMAWKDTGLPWVIPSPSKLCFKTLFATHLTFVTDMPTPDTALMYPGTCMFEGTNLSEGRGTTRPFEVRHTS